jgi:hypothetical protein
MTRLSKGLPWLVTIAGSGLLASHVLKRDEIQVDQTALLLLLILLLVPVIDSVRRIKFGEFEAEISPREVADVKAKISNELPAATETESPETDPYASIVDLVRSDAQLGFAKLRLELEQLLRSLYSSRRTDETRRALRLDTLVNYLSRQGHISPEFASSLKDILRISSRVVHGEYIRQNDAEQLAITGSRILEELLWIYREIVLKPFASTIIDRQELEDLRSSKYRVTTVIPLVQDPRRNVYILDQDGLDRFLEGYEEYAEFIVSIERLDETTPSSSPRLDGSALQEGVTSP